MQSRLLLGLTLTFFLAHVQAAPLQQSGLTQGQFASSADERALLQEMTRNFGSEVIIRHPDDDPAYGDGNAFDNFGVAVALSGDTAIVGAYFDDNAAGTGAGSAYVYTRSNGAWQQQAKLMPSSAPESGMFGWSVAIKDDTVLVGAVLSNGSGAVYVFNRVGTVWAEQAMLVAADAGADDYFGWSVALDTDIAVIGAALDDTSAGIDSGSAYVFVRSGGVWSQQTQLLPSDAAAGDGFGLAVALSGAGALIGAPFDDNSTGADSGSAYMYTSNLGAWSEQAKLTAADGAAGDQFGGAVALLDARALVGAWQDDTAAGADAGSVHVFERSAGLWNATARLTASDAAASDFFGESVALGVDTVVVGAFSHGTAAAQDAGAAYVYTSSGNQWLEQAQLRQADPAEGDNFAGSVAISGTTVLAGCNYDDNDAGIDAGSATVFTGSGPDWTEQAKLTAGVGHGLDLFGYALAIEGNTALISTLRPAGAVHVFVRSGSTWQLQATLSSVDARPYNRFGAAVALSGDTALIGEPSAESGAVHVFVRSDGVWSQQARLVADDAAGNASFGQSLALSGDTALIGAPDASEFAVFAGAAYVYRRTGTSWCQQARLDAPTPDSGDQFGTAVALSGDTALIGTPNFDHNGAEAGGAVLVFQRDGDTWLAAAQLNATDPTWHAGFGRSLAISNDTVVIGAPQDRNAENVAVGAAFVFTKAAGVWSEQAKLLGSDNVANGRFGWNVAIEGNTALIGTWAPPDKPGPGLEAGFVYLYARGQGIWAQQARLTPSAGAPNDQYGISVALSQNDALIGAPFTDSTVTDNRDVGSVYALTRQELLFGDGFEY